jgi:hypothetical protein
VVTDDEKKKRTIFYDSGHAVSRDPGERLLVTKDGLSPGFYTLAEGRSTASISNTIPVSVWDPSRPDAGKLSYVTGAELPDLSTIVRAYKRLIAERYTGPVGFVGDSLSVTRFLKRERGLHIWWMGEDLAPRILQEIEAMAGYFDLVEYKWVPREENPAGVDLENFQRSLRARRFG